MARAGCSTAIVHEPPFGARPSTRRSPPMSTQTPATPARSASPTSRSAARPLPMPPGSNPVPGGQAHDRVGVVDLDVAARPHEVAAARGPLDREDGRAAREQSLSERVVAGAHDVAEHGRVERAARQAPRLDRLLDEEQRRRVDADRLSGVGVEAADLAVGEEPAPAPFEPPEQVEQVRRQRRRRRRRGRGGPRCPSPGRGSSGRQLPWLEASGAAAPEEPATGPLRRQLGRRSATSCRGRRLVGRDGGRGRRRRRRCRRRRHRRWRRSRRRWRRRRRGGCAGPGGGGGRGGRSTARSSAPNLGAGRGQARAG